MTEDEKLEMDKVAEEAKRELEEGVKMEFHDKPPVQGAKDEDVEELMVDVKSGKGGGSEELAEMKEKMLRLAAEFDNYKKRTRKDIEEAGIIAKANLLKDILPVLDEFQLAIAAMDKSEDKGLVDGVAMLYSNLMETLKKNGLSEVDTEGKFDPFKHEIVMVRESKEKEGTIIEVMAKGYEVNGRMIRPAAVVVAKPAEEKKDKGAKQ
jgi:molecular chaperone GrpE